ncbi:uncharacterized protein [Prorops nasuta]|uniref:uncharacterized protein n=1 Tax=Prorops nasuta TaxID=863751 RepID=UPI0034CD9B16
MGACFGRCFMKFTDSISYRLYQRHTNMSCQEDEQAEYSHIDDNRTQFKKSKTLLEYLSLKRLKGKHRIPVSLELTEDRVWSRGSNKYSRLDSKINDSTSSGLDSFQILDARSFIRQQISSTPGSSLDLEWEHEGIPVPFMDYEASESIINSVTQTTVNNSQPSSLAASPWSRMSTPNSLEWDPVEMDIVRVDVETEQLLNEIEMLTNRALKETGEWTNTDS